MAFPRSAPRAAGLLSWRFWFASPRRIGAGASSRKFALPLLPSLPLKAYPYCCLLCLSCPRKGDASRHRRAALDNSCCARWSS